MFDLRNPGYLVLLAALLGPPLTPHAHAQISTSTTSEALSSQNFSPQNFSSQTFSSQTFSSQAFFSRSSSSQPSSQSFSPQSSSQPQPQAQAQAQPDSQQELRIPSQPHPAPPTPRRTELALVNDPAHRPDPSAYSDSSAPAGLPDAPGFQQPSQPSPPATGTISGIVVDANNAAVQNALVVLQADAGAARLTTLTDARGTFQFPAAESGIFRLTITAAGFATWTSASLTLLPGQLEELAPATLQVASAISNVDVTATQHDIAQEQMQLQEMQRVLGFIPNFYVSYIWGAAPLSTGQKFHLALRSSVDPVTIAIAAGVAGVQQWQNDYVGYGQGAEGYAKRFGAVYANTVIGTVMGGAIFASVLHQDPRYFYKGTGSIRSRALYAIATVVICKGDNGHWQPNYSNVLGNLASAGISNAYYPDQDRDGADVIVANSLISTAEGAIGNLFQEFLVKKISRGVPSAAISAGASTHP